MGGGSSFISLSDLTCLDAFVPDIPTILFYHARDSTLEVVWESSLEEGRGSGELSVSNLCCLFPYLKSWNPSQADHLPSSRHRFLLRLLP